MLWKERGDEFAPNKEDILLRLEDKISLNEVVCFAVSEGKRH